MGNLDKCLSKKKSRLATPALLVVKPALSQMYDQLLPTSKSLEIACKHHCTGDRRPVTCVYLDLGILRLLLPYGRGGQQPRSRSTVEVKTAGYAGMHRHVEAERFHVRRSPRQSWRLGGQFSWKDTAVHADTLGEIRLQARRASVYIFLTRGKTPATSYRYRPLPE